jgi:hypothetical protein
VRTNILLLLYFDLIRFRSVFPILATTCFITAVDSHCIMIYTFTLPLLLLVKGIKLTLSL